MRVDRMIGVRAGEAQDAPVAAGIGEPAADRLDEIGRPEMEGDRGQKEESAAPGSADGSGIGSNVAASRFASTCSGASSSA